MSPLRQLLSLLVLGSHVLPGGASPAPLPAPQDEAKKAPKPAGAKAGEVFVPNPGVGPGGKTFVDSAHFRLYDAPPDLAKKGLNLLEGSYDCFVTGLKWRSSGISYNSKSDDQPTKYKINIYASASLGSAAGFMGADAKTGYSFVKVIKGAVADPTVIVHEYGHALTYHERTWVNQGQTGVWWEPVANWFAETYINSDVCAASRAKFNTTSGNMRLPAETVGKVMAAPWRTLVDGSKGSGNYYQAWPLLTYLTNNPDKVKGLGPDSMRQMFRTYKRGSNETPFHAIANIAGGQAAVGPIVGRYWARMAFADIGHKALSTAYNQGKARVKFDHASGSGSSFTGKPDKAPKYMGANWIALKPTGGTMNINVKAEGQFTAVVGVKSGGSVKYTLLEGGKGSVQAPAGADVKLSIANTPSKLLMYDGFKVSSGAVSNGLKYTVSVTGGTVAGGGA